MNSPSGSTIGAPNPPHALDLWAGRKAAPVRDDELEAPLEGPLFRPGRLAVDHAAMDEKDAGAGDPGILGTDTK